MPVGTNGNDVLNASLAAELFNGLDGNDTANYASSSAGIKVDFLANSGVGGWAQGDTYQNMENITGSNFADALYGNAVANILLGGGGNDVLEGRGGADTLNGGLGVDTAQYLSSTAGVTVNLNLATQVSGGDATGDVLVSIENVTGSNLADVLTGNTGANVLVGGVGNDVLQGMAGADTLSGGSGIDTASYAASNAGVNVSLMSGAVNSGGHALGDVLTSIENLTGSAFSDNLNGNSGANVLNGGNNNDWLGGYGGNDTLLGGNGYDTLDGGAGADVLNGGADYDWARYVDSSVGETINLNLAVQISAGDANGDSLISIENIWGSNHDDQITTLDSASTVQTIRGLDGNDTLVGMSGIDQLFGDDGDDTLNGGLNDDYLYGGRGDDMILGGEGADLLADSLGSNTMTGGNGADVFNFVPTGFINNNQAMSDTTVTDFELGVDSLQVSSNATNIYLSGSSFETVVHVTQFYVDFDAIQVQQVTITLEGINMADFSLDTIQTV